MDAASTCPSSDDNATWLASAEVVQRVKADIQEEIMETMLSSLQAAAMVCASNCMEKILAHARVSDLTRQAMEPFVPSQPSVNRCSVAEEQNAEACVAVGSRKGSLGSIYPAEVVFENCLDVSRGESAADMQRKIAELESLVTEMNSDAQKVARHAAAKQEIANGRLAKLEGEVLNIGAAAKKAACEALVMELAKGRLRTLECEMPEIHATAARPASESVAKQEIATSRTEGEVANADAAWLHVSRQAGDFPAVVHMLASVEKEADVAATRRIREGTSAEKKINDCIGASMLPHQLSSATQSHYGGGKLIELHDHFPDAALKVARKAFVAQETANFRNSESERLVAESYVPSERKATSGGMNLLESGVTEAIDDLASQETARALLAELRAVSHATSLQQSSDVRIADFGCEADSDPVRLTTRARIVELENQVAEANAAAQHATREAVTAREAAKACVAESERQRADADAEKQRTVNEAAVAQEVANYRIAEMEVQVTRANAAAEKAASHAALLRVRVVELEGQMAKVAAAASRTGNSDGVASDSAEEALPGKTQMVCEKTLGRSAGDHVFAAAHSLGAHSDGRVVATRSDSGRVTATRSDGWLASPRNDGRQASPSKQGVPCYLRGGYHGPQKQGKLLWK